MVKLHSPRLPKDRDAASPAQRRRYRAYTVTDYGDDRPHRDGNATLDPRLAEQLHHLFDNPDRTAVPTGVLAWFGSTNFPDGAGDKAALDQTEWARLYTRIESAAIAPGIVTPLQTLLGATYSHRADGPVPIAIAHFELEEPNANLQRRVRDAAEAGTALDPAPHSLAAVVTRRRAFFVSALLRPQFGHDIPSVRGRRVTWLLDRTFYSTNAGAPDPDSIEIDTGDGYHEVTWGSQVYVTYPRDGAVIVSVRCRYGDMLLEGHTRVMVSDTPAAPAPDETWPLAGTTAGVSGRAYVFHAPGHTGIVNPIVVAEGFPGGYPYDYVYDALSGNGLLATLRQRGFDLIVVSYDGTRRMQENAEVVAACVREALARVRPLHQTGTPLVVGGVSMGGVVSRFALATMESRGEDHGARLFFTVDSPHGGAYTNVANQWLLNFLKPASALSRLYSALLNSPANQQFMTLWVDGGITTVSPLRTEFLADLAAVGGYPQKPRRIAVANGRGDGKRTIADHALLLRWSAAPFGWATLEALAEGDEPSVVARGYCLRSDPAVPSTLTAQSAVSWEGAPGGLNTYNALAGEVVRSLALGDVQDPAPVTTAISTLSALDIDPARYAAFSPVPPPGSGASPFHDYLCGTENTRHISITAEASTWLAAQIGEPSPAIS